MELKRRNISFKKSSIIAVLCIFFLNLACNSENAPDCFQNTGQLTRIEVAVPFFTKITVFENLNLVLKQGEEQLVEIESGEFLINDIFAEVENDRLLLRDENGCNIFRSYGISTVYVTSPNISEIRSSTGGFIISDGVLNYPNLSLISETFIDSSSETTDGSFDITIANNSVRVVINGIAYLKLQGTTQTFNINIPAGNSRIEAENLEAQHVSLNHRGTNNLLVNPQQRIDGVIRGYGDVISVNRPQEVEVEEIFNGRLIFRN